ncbi:MAG: c-type cytochrome [Anaerolineae bacterium]|nr:c-type cytochrome [Anaerolineae bacterium]
MSQQQVSQGGTIVVLIILLAGCGGNAPASVAEAPAATAAPEQTTTPTSEPVTPTPESPTATPIPEPPTSTPEPPTATSTLEPVVSTPTAEPPPAIAEESAINPLTAGNPERGREIFETGGGIISVENSCSQCHSLDGTVKEHGSAGPSFQGISERASNRAPELAAVEYLRQSIVDPNAYVVEGFSSNRMPKAYKFFLSEEEIEDLVAFMLTQ